MGLGLLLLDVRYLLHILLLGRHLLLHGLAHLSYHLIRILLLNLWLDILLGLLMMWLLRHSFLLLSSSSISFLSLLLLLIERYTFSNVNIKFPTFSIWEAVQLKLKDFTIILTYNISNYLNNSSLLLRCELINKLF